MMNARIKPNFLFPGSPEPRIRFQHYTSEPGQHSALTNSYFRSANEKDYVRDSRAAVPDYETLIARELAFKKPFFDALNALLAEAGYPQTDARQLFAQNARDPDWTAVIGSQNLLVLRDYQHDLRPQLLETTTPYQFRFGLFHHDVFGRTCLVPLLEMDSRPLRLLEQYGVPSADMRRFLTDFLTQRDNSGHDFEHQIVEPLRLHSTLDFADLHAIGNARGFMRNEYHALALYAKLWRYRFEHEPGLKDETLGQVAGLARAIADMQDKALNQARAENAGPDAERRIAQATTFLAETVLHSAFRILPPSDRGWERPVSLPHGGMSSVRAELDRLHVEVPKALAAREKLDTDAQGFERLRTNCRDWLGDTYEHIHHVSRLPVLDKTQPGPRVQVGLVELVGKLAETAKSTVRA